MNEIRKRVEWIDYCKAIAIFLVSFAHILGCLPRDTIGNILLLLCYSIELPMFFCFLEYREDCSLKIFL